MSLTFSFEQKQPTKEELFQKGVYPPEFSDEFKEYIRERDKHCCALCKKKRPLDVHHINYTKYTVKINCISLCRECHERVHFYFSERHHWSHLLYQIAQEREGVYTFEQFRKAWKQRA